MKKILCRIFGHKAVAEYLPVCKRCKKVLLKADDMVELDPEAAEILYKNIDKYI